VAKSGGGKTRVQHDAVAGVMGSHTLELTGALRSIRRDTMLMFPLITIWCSGVSPESARPKLVSNGCIRCASGARAASIARAYVHTHTHTHTHTMRVTAFIDSPEAFRFLTLRRRASSSVFFLIIVSCCLSVSGIGLAAVRVPYARRLRGVPTPPLSLPDADPGVSARTCSAVVCTRVQVSVHARWQSASVRRTKEPLCSGHWKHAHRSRCYHACGQGLDGGDVSTIKRSKDTAGRASR
jgi:hypothetical protein